jgi:hypothetical protein
MHRSAPLDRNVAPKCRPSIPRPLGKSERVANPSTKFGVAIGRDFGRVGDAASTIKSCKTGKAGAHALFATRRIPV